MQIDWGQQPTQLLVGDVSQLAPDIQAMLKELADRIEVRVVALRIHVMPLILVIGLIAREAEISGNRAAGRIARSILKNLSTEQLHEFTSLLEF